MKIVYIIDNPKLISNNDMYMHPVRKTKNGRYMSYVVKSPYLNEVQEYYKETLQTLISDEDIENLKKDMTNTYVGLSLMIKLGVPLKDIYANDMSNFIKAYEDCISRRLGIDDSRNLFVSIEEKFYESFDNHWRMITEISTRTIEKMEDGDGNTN